MKTTEQIKQEKQKLYNEHVSKLDFIMTSTIGDSLAKKYPTCDSAKKWNKLMNQEIGSGPNPTLFEFHKLITNMLYIQELNK